MNSSIKIKKISMLGLFIILSSVLFFPMVRSETSEKSTNNLFIIAFLIIIIILSVLVITENPLVSFLIENYKITILVLIFLFIFVYFISNTRLQSITGFFVVPKTTTTVTKTIITSTPKLEVLKKKTTTTVTTSTVITTTVRTTTTILTGITTTTTRVTTVVTTFLTETTTRMTTTTTIPSGTQPAHSFDCSTDSINCTLETVTITNSDKSKTTVNYQKPINFFNESSKKWQPIDKKIKLSSKSGWKYTNNGFYGIDINDTHVKIEKDNTTFIFRPILPIQLSKIKDNKLTWNISNALLKANVEITFDEAKIEKLITIYSINPNLLSLLPNFNYSESFDVYGASLDYSNLKLGDTLSIARNVTMWDNCGNIYPLTEWDVEGKSLSFNINKDWFNQSCFPYWIDPDIKFNYKKEIDFYKINNDLNDYYFSANSTQNINDIQDSWTKNDICLGLYLSNRWHEFCGGSLDWVWYNSTNYMNYMNLTGIAEIKYAGYNFNVRVEYYLGKDYPEIKEIVILENTGNKNIVDSYVKIKTHDININKTYENNNFRINTTSFWEPWDGWKEYNLNEDLDLSYTQNDLVSRKFGLFDNSTESWVELEWNDSYWNNGIRNDMNYNISVKKGSEYNSPVDLLLITGSLNKNDLITTNFRWANAVKQNFINAIDMYESLDNKIHEIYRNSTQFYIQDLNMTLEMKPNNVIHYKDSLNIVNDTISEWNAFSIMAWKFKCFKLPRVDPQIDYFDTLVCPENKINLIDIITSFAKKEIQLPERNTSITYSIYYLFLNRQTGILDNYTLKIYGQNASTIENEIFRKGRVKISSLFDNKNYKQETEFDVCYPTVNDNSLCIRFPLVRWSNLMINVTMLNPITNFTFGREEFIIENYTVGNSVIARLRPYPCCDVFYTELQTGEVCSG